MGSNIEDSLILKYHNDYSGKIYKEVPVGRVDNKKRQRRIDAILIEGEENNIYIWGEYSIKQVKKDIKGKKIHLIEAKRRLGRNVIGQVEVGKYLAKKDFDPKEILCIALCGKGHSDLEEYCDNKDIKVKIYKIKYNNTDIDSELISEEIDNIKDIRKKPDKSRFVAFLRGWKDATNNNLYNSIK